LAIDKTRLTEHSDEWRAFYRQQADRLLELARGCDRSTARTLTAAAYYYLNKLEPPPGHNLVQSKAQRSDHCRLMRTPEQNPAEIACPVCGGPMDHRVTLVQEGAHPELRTFRCERCRHVETQVLPLRPDPSLSKIADVPERDGC
jgi:hypothetical protein